MMGGHIGNAATFLVETLFSFYIFIVMLRLLLEWVRADLYNPISQFIFKMTEPALALLRRVVFLRIGGVDAASVVFLVVLQCLEFWIIMGIIGRSISVAALFVFSLAELLQLGIYVFLFSILIEVIMSWLNPSTYNPMLNLIRRLNEPLLTPARRLVPPIGGLDLSPIVVMVVLQFATILFIGPLRQFAGALG